ncbi:MAG: hypothetical protein IPK83_17000 [Planctomycetes bacterium]|nr:hypothetical protein [Planctomycetota bacterium]
MARKNKWKDLAPLIIYNGYPDSDLLPIDPPKAHERIESFKVRAEEAGDTLFLFLCREADDEIDAYEYLVRLDRAIRDIEQVRFAVIELIGTSDQSTNSIM